MNKTTRGSRRRSTGLGKRLSLVGSIVAFALAILAVPAFAGGTDQPSAPQGPEGNILLDGTGGWRPYHIPRATGNARSFDPVGQVTYRTSTEGEFSVSGRMTWRAVKWQRGKRVRTKLAFQNLFVETDPGSAVSTLAGELRGDFIDICEFDLPSNNSGYRLVASPSDCLASSAFASRLRNAGARIAAGDPMGRIWFSGSLGDEVQSGGAATLQIKATTYGFLGNAGLSLTPSDPCGATMSYPVCADLPITGGVAYNRGGIEISHDEEVTISGGNLPAPVALENIITTAQGIDVTRQLNARGSGGSLPNESNPSDCINGALPSPYNTLPVLCAQPIGQGATQIWAPGDEYPVPDSTVVVDTAIQSNVDFGDAYLNSGSSSCTNNDDGTADCTKVWNVWWNPAFTNSSIVNGLAVGFNMIGSIGSPTDTIGAACAGIPPVSTGATTALGYSSGCFSALGVLTQTYTIGESNL